MFRKMAFGKWSDNGPAHGGRYSILVVTNIIIGTTNTHQPYGNHQGQCILLTCYVRSLQICGYTHIINISQPFSFHSFYMKYMILRIDLIESEC
jgi:hypothetical protein